jgi:hypothetical protein
MYAEEKSKFADHLIHKRNKMSNCEEIITIVHTEEKKKSTH